MSNPGDRWLSIQRAAVNDRVRGGLMERTELALFHLLAKLFDLG